MRAMLVDSEKHLTFCYSWNFTKKKKKERKKKKLVKLLLSLSCSFSQ